MERIYVIQNGSNMHNHTSDGSKVESAAFVWSLVCMMFIVSICFCCFCYLFCTSDDRFRVPPFGETVEEEEAQEERRKALILANVIHKKVEKREEEEGISLPHGKTITKTHLMNMPSGDDQDPLNEQTGSTPLSLCDSLSSHNNSRRQKRNRKQDINNRSMRSIRRAMNVKTDSTLSSYSPMICPICMEPYRTDEEIAWSSNDECPHAFHLECIMGWLIDHSTCPMCRVEYMDMNRCENV